jgi:mono/diheme cytochrome c family protein
VRFRIHRTIGFTLGGLCALVLVSFAYVYGRSEMRIRRRYPVPSEPPLTLSNDSATIARGRHLATATAVCVVCHGDDMGGMVYSDAGPVFRVVGPNLTGGRGGRGGRIPGSSDVDWELALRHGVHADGRSLVIMPAEVYAHLTNSDAVAILSYLRQLPPVDRTLPSTHFGPVGRFLLTKPTFTALVAEKTPRIPHAAEPPPDTSIEYGAYLADIGGCRGCHGLHLSGGHVLGPPGTPPAANLTPRGLSGWTEAEFVRTIRTGRTRSGAVLNTFMPWPVLGRMTDTELHAIWRYLQTVPPEDFGKR